MNRIVSPDQSFVNAIALFDKHVSHYWIDSGSLLGLVRDQRLLPWDSDIDFGIDASEMPRLLALNEELKSEGVKTSHRIWQGHVYGTTVHLPGMMPVHFHAFWNDGETAWSPQTVNYYKMGEADIGGAKPPYPFMRWALQTTYNLGTKPYTGPYLWRLFQAYAVRYVWAIFRRMRGRYPREIWAGRYPFSAIHDMATWKIPAHHFTRLIEVQVGNATIKMPSQTKDYLALRYGNWRVPQKDWVYWLHDRALHQGDPAEHGLMENVHVA